MATTTRRKKGSGSITNVGRGRWRIRKTVDGHKIDEYVTGTKNDAKKRLDEATRHVISSGDTTTYTLRSYYVDRYLPRRLERRTEATREMYRHAWRHIEKFSLVDDELRVPRLDDVQEWVDGMSSGTARTSYKCLRAIYKHAYGNGLLPTEPLKDIRVTFPRPEAKPEPRVWSAAQCAEAVSLLRGSDVEAYVLFGVGAGLRREEILGLDWERVKIEYDENGMAIAWITVTRALTETDGLHATKTPNSDRCVCILEPLATRIATLARADGHRGPVLRTKRGRLKVGGLKRRWANLWRPKNDARPDGPLVHTDEETGRVTELVPRIPPNHLRHSVITIAKATDLDSDLGAAYFGHAAGTIEKQHYLKLTREAAIKVGFAISRRYAEHLEQVTN